MKPSNQSLRANASRASTEDLMNRVTVFREVMEPDALVIFEEELARRGVNQSDISAHAEKTLCLRSADGYALECSRCHQPAVAEVWGWQRIFWGWLPLFPRRFRYCREHMDRRAAFPG